MKSLFCSKCKTRPHKKGHSYCTECDSIMRKVRIERLKREDPVAFRKAMQRSNRIARFRYYRITSEEYEAALESQKNRCKICKKLFTGEDRMTTAHIDHDHKTWRFRGLLCHDCNLVLGKLGDNPHLFMRVSLYLRGQLA